MTKEGFFVEVTPEQREDLSAKSMETAENKEITRFKDHGIEMGLAPNLNIFCLNNKQYLGSFLY